MRMRGYILAVLALVAFLPSCKSRYESILSSNDADLKYKAAFEMFNQGKYNKAAQLFESLSVLTSGTERDDTVQYYWGLSNYRFKDYYTAETNFARFLENYPGSPFAEEAQFQRIDCLYRSTLRYELDPTPTHAAITAIAEYIRERPDNPHMENCKTMLRDLSGRLDRKVLKEDADNIYREDILYYIAMSSYKFAYFSVPEKQKDRYLTFVDDYYNFIGENPESKYRHELDVMYRRTQRALGRYEGTEEDLKEKDKDFERERRLLGKEEKK